MQPNGFDLFRRRPFGDDARDPNLTPDFRQSPGNVAPAGFVDHVENKTTNVRIDETGLHVTNGEIELETASGDVTIDSTGITVEGGAITVTSPTGTVIIDGASNMFKIAATGTVQTALFTGPGERSATVTLQTGLTYVPAFIHGAQWNTISGAYSADKLVWDTATGLVIDGLHGEVELVNGDETLFRATTRTTRSSPDTAARNYRYYILKETAF